MAAYYNRSISYYFLKKYDNCIADSTRAIELNPEFAQAYHMRAIAYRMTGQTEKSEADYKKEEELGRK
jgi:tetratricopeptide (TPR) repeat protein